jgi:molybdate transport system substrate-binding protein
MTWSRRHVLAGLLGSALVATTACSAGSAGDPNGTELLVFAAASLKAPLERVASAYEAGHPGIEIGLAFDSSAALRTQIEQGAPADLFLSADLVNPERLVDAGLGGGPVTAFTGNAVVIAAPLDNLGIEAWFDLARDGVAIVAAAPDVPITAYAAQLVDGLATTPDAPPGFAAGYERNIVSREDNVRAVVAKLELGEGDAGIVYRTDAIASAKLRTIPLPDGIGVAVSYGGVTLTRSAHAAEAEAFLAWLGGPDGQALLAEFGFVPAP